MHDFRNATISCVYSPYFLALSDKCIAGFMSLLAYSGDTCIEDKNGCAEIECFRGIDIPAPGSGAEC